MTVTDPNNAPQITPEHLRQLNEARSSMKKIRRTVRIALFDGWSVGLFGALTLLFGYSSLVGIILGGAMVLIGIVEVRAAAHFRNLRAQSARTLAINQLALAVLLIGYALWSLHSLSSAKPSEAMNAAQSDPQLKAMLQGAEDLEPLIERLVYQLLIVVAVGYQGGMSLYYFSRRKYAQAYLTQTPPWITEMQRSGISI